ncbi:2,3-diphosphoglycerate-dependent phosphoglycerate mutase [Streptomyces sp. NPDC050560]|uniref:2,3-diphosphoglycerate-dependent phosphoglycerate mutase n=1 Tax=Streptomyces sp. NPDC050560 TaxID=3365630 RepID=UPI0037967C14
MRTLILLRHGESEWNSKNLFTGWVDVGLTARGEEQARAAGVLIRAAGLAPATAHTSVLRRAYRTCHLALRAAGTPKAPVARTRRLNERHYGALQGRDKAEVLHTYGEERFRAWRRSYDAAPPPIEPGDPWDVCPAGDTSGEPVPRTESLADVTARLLPYWEAEIAPALREGAGPVLVVAHSNSLRALAAHLDGLGGEELMRLNIPTGIPLAYELDPALRPVRRGGSYLDPVAAEAGARAVAEEGHRGRAPETRP